jgi:hypothetical protein
VLYTGTTTDTRGLFMRFASGEAVCQQSIPRRNREKELAAQPAKSTIDKRDPIDDADACCPDAGR